MNKVNVAVVVEYDLNGNACPLSLKWTNDRVYSIDQILDVRQAASLKAGGQGTRYTCRLSGKQFYLFCDEGRWFVER